ncbi:uncharacterized protein EAE97_009682 [Botrytis byssoidea]|uniref:Uncharacterized protein n=1 Tax=Botrytis byssoidea TaxID=139641 RepID=A0A9P5LYN1_9HELO|nr:uncharacterized protein EAE97_009682 [Botrytis byssoidea]KAF7928840.1 hypothetical protein EAE97_009682 [Botrytis byssoidea]
MELWLSKGNIEFKNITVFYLNLNLNIISNQKIIIYGHIDRFVILSYQIYYKLMFKLVTKIILNNIDIKKVRLDNTVLSPSHKIHYYYQIKPYEQSFKSFLQGAAGIDNLSGTASDSILYNYHPILDKPLASYPELSVGQGQLLALYRTLIKAQKAQYTRCKPVVLLNKVTSSLNSITELIIYNIIDNEFI